MNRHEIERSYTVRDGIIRSPGKFEGERRWTPYFWNAVLEGAEDDFQDGNAIINVMPEDIIEFPELEHVAAVMLHEDDYGFVRAIPVARQ